MGIGTCVHSYIWRSLRYVGEFACGKVGTNDFWASSKALFKSFLRLRSSPNCSCIMQLFGVSGAAGPGVQVLECKGGEVPAVPSAERPSLQPHSDPTRITCATWFRVLRNVYTLTLRSLSFSICSSLFAFVDGDITSGLAVTLVKCVCVCVIYLRLDSACGSDQLTCFELGGSVSQQHF